MIKIVLWILAGILALSGVAVIVWLCSRARRNLLDTLAVVSMLAWVDHSTPPAVHSTKEEQ